MIGPDKLRIARRRAAFTLIERLGVIAILLVLTSPLSGKLFL
jgi:hypothetical protein